MPPGVRPPGAIRSRTRRTHQHVEAGTRRSRPRGWLRAHCSFGQTQRLLAPVHVKALNHGSGRTGDAPDWRNTATRGTSESARSCASCSACDRCRSCRTKASRVLLRASSRNGTNWQRATPRSRPGRCRREGDLPVVLREVTVILTYRRHWPTGGRGDCGRGPLFPSGGDVTHALGRTSRRARERIPRRVPLPGWRACSAGDTLHRLVGFRLAHDPGVVVRRRSRSAMLVFTWWRLVIWVRPDAHEEVRPRGAASAGKLLGHAAHVGSNLFVRE